MNTKFSRILFDYDGTILIHDKENEARFIAEILKIEDEKFSEFERGLNRLFSMGFSQIKKRKMTYDIYCDLVKRVMFPLGQFNITAQDVIYAIEENSTTHSKLAKDIIPTLQYLQNKCYKLCIFTNGFYDFQARSMKYHGVFEYFENIYAWDNFYAKPDKRAIVRALDGAQPETTVMIGDSLKNDIIVQKQMGIYTIGYNIPEEELICGAPDVNITCYEELRHLL